MSERSDREPNGSDESDSAETDSADVAGTDSNDAESTSRPAESPRGPVTDHVADDDSDTDSEPDSPIQESQQRRRPRRPATSFEAAPRLSPDESTKDKSPVRERPDRMPRTVRFAVIALFVLAGLLLLTAAVLYFGREQQATEAIKVLQEGDETDIPTKAEILRASVIAAAIQGGLGLLAAVGAWWTRAGKQWSRLLSMAVATFVAVLLLQSVFTGAVSIISLVVLVLAVVALIFLANRATAEWCGAPPRQRR